MSTLQARGAHVLKFGRMVPNFGRIGELTQAILEMLRSQDWRDYADARGEYHFLQGEFDYFLAEHGVAASDLPRLYLRVDKDRDEKKELVAAMDHKNKDERYRRAPEMVMEAHPHGSLRDNWERYGWAPVKHPLGYRAAMRARTNVTLEKHARQQRQRQVKDRRTQLDDVVAGVVSRTRNETELRYIIDELHKRVGKRGRPLTDPDQWARDFKKLNGNAKALAKHWKLSQNATYTRIRRITNKSRFIGSQRKAS